MKSKVVGFPNALNDQRHTAVHEAGHAVVGRILTMKCGGASIQQDYDSAGQSITHDPYAIQEAWEDQGKFRDYRSVMIGRIMTFMAGAESEVELLGLCEGGDGDDRLQIAFMLESLTSNEVHDLANYESKLRVKTRSCIRRHKKTVRHVAEALMAKGSLSSDEIDSIVFSGPRLVFTQRLWKAREEDRDNYRALKGAIIP